MFLMIAKLSKSYTEIISFRVKYENVPEQYSILAKHDSIMNVKVKAFGFNLIAHNFFQHTLTVNFKKDVKKSGDMYVWETKKGLSDISSELGSKIEILSIEPDSLTFPFEIMMVKTVPIILETEISYEPGYDIQDRLMMVPDSVKVIGPKNAIEKISRIKTEQLKIMDVNSSINKDVKLVLNKSFENVKLSRSNIKVSGKVEKFTEGTFEVPVNIINLPSDVKINYFPKTVQVAYYVSLENYKKIKALDFEIVCDYEETNGQENTFFIPQLVSKPDLVKSTKIKQGKVEFIIIE